jgi:hypothetical protein
MPFHHTAPPPLGSSTVKCGIRPPATVSGPLLLFRHRRFHSTLSHFPEVRLATLTTTRSVSAGSLLAGISVLSQASHQLPLLQLLGKIPIHTLSGFSKALQKFTQRFRKGNCLRLGRR